MSSENTFEVESIPTWIWMQLCLRRSLFANTLNICVGLARWLLQNSSILKTNCEIHHKTNQRKANLRIQNSISQQVPSISQPNPTTGGLWSPTTTTPHDPTRIDRSCTLDVEIGTESSSIGDRGIKFRICWTLLICSAGDPYKWCVFIPNPQRKACCMAPLPSLRLFQQYMDGDWLTFKACILKDWIRQWSNWPKCSSASQHQRELIFLWTDVFVKEDSKLSLRQSKRFSRFVRPRQDRVSRRFQVGLQYKQVESSSIHECLERFYQCVFFAYAAFRRHHAQLTCIYATQKKKFFSERILCYSKQLFQQAPSFTPNSFLTQDETDCKSCISSDYAIDGTWYLGASLGPTSNSREFTK